MEKDQNRAHDHRSDVARIVLRDGVLDATLGGMQLYYGQGSGKFTLDASKPVPTFTGNLARRRLDATAA